MFLLLMALMLPWVSAIACHRGCQGRRCQPREAQQIKARPGYGLSCEDREAIRQKVRRMRQDGAWVEQIRAAVSEIITSHGIDIPRCKRRSLMLSLNDEERKAIGQKIRQMRDAGATRLEITAAVIDMIRGMGIRIRPVSSPWSESSSQGTTWGRLKSQYR